jgi:phosphoribosylaminoimidazole synthetase
LITSATDGVGTKIELAKEHEYYDGIGIDLVAMSVNDMVVRGSKPILFLDYLAMNKLDAPVFRNIISSIKQGCKLADIKLVGGETAEMGSMYKYKSFDLAGFCVGSIGNNILPQIDRVKRGCKIYGLKSNGVHSNGFSLIRKILKIHDHNPHTFLKPTKIYMECLGMIERYGDKLLGMAHITGGGLSGNIKRIIPSDLKIKIDIEIKDEFLWLMEKGKLSYNQMLETFNCGYGIALIFEEGFDIELDQIGTIF